MEMKPIGKITLIHCSYDIVFHWPDRRDVNCKDEQGNYWSGMQKKGQPIDDVHWRPAFAMTGDGQKVDPNY